MCRYKYKKYESANFMGSWNPHKAAATSGESEIFSPFHNDSFFGAVFLLHPHGAVGVQMTRSFRLKLRFAYSANSDRFTFFSGQTLMNLKNCDCGDVVPIPNTFQMFLTYSFPAFRWGCSSINTHDGLQLDLLQRSVPRRPSHFQVHNSQTPLICFALIMPQYVFLISKRPWVSTNKPQR